MVKYFSAFIVLFNLSVTAQTTDATPQKDIIDVLKSIIARGHNAHAASMPTKPREVDVTIVPAVGFSLSTGGAAVLSTNAAFYKGDKSKTTSSNIATINH